jgi:cell division protein ZapA
MSQEQDPQVSVKILDRTYRIKCAQDEATALRSAAGYVDRQMRKLRQSGRVNSTDSMAVVVALNTAHELMKKEKATADNMAQLEENILRITRHIDQTLAKEKLTEV